MFKPPVIRGPFFLLILFGVKIREEVFPTNLHALESADIFPLLIQFERHLILLRQRDGFNSSGQVQSDQTPFLAEKADPTIPILIVPDTRERLRLIKMDTGLLGECSGTAQEHCCNHYPTGELHWEILQ